ESDTDDASPPRAPCEGARAQGSVSPADWLRRRHRDAGWHPGQDGRLDQGSRSGRPRSDRGRIQGLPGGTVARAGCAAAQEVGSEDPVSQKDKALTIKWSDPTTGILDWVLTHPAYAGVYLYGRAHWRHVQAGGEPVPPHRAIGQFVLIEEHHEKYITPEEYQQNREFLALNRKGPRRSQLGPGSALLQGLVCCG